MMSQDVFTSAPSGWGPRAEEMVTWFMGKYGVERDPAIGGIAEFVAGKGQPSAELFTEFPELAQMYYAALKGTPVTE